MLNSHSVERVASASIFWNFWRAFKRCSRQTPAMWRRKNVRTQSETKNHCLPLLFGKSWRYEEKWQLSPRRTVRLQTGGSEHVLAPPTTLWVRYKSPGAAGPPFYPTVASQDYVNERSRKSRGQRGRWADERCCSVAALQVDLWLLRFRTKLQFLCNNLTAQQQRTTPVMSPPAFFCSVLWFSNHFTHSGLQPIYSLWCSQGRPKVRLNYR